MRYDDLAVRNGVWWADYRDRSGKRHRFSLKIPSTVSYKNAIIILEEVRKEREMQRFELQLAIDEVLEWKRAQVDFKTVWQYESTWRNLVDFLASRSVVFTTDITPEHMAEWARVLIENFKPLTANNKLTVAGILFRAWHILGRMPAFSAARYINPFRVKKPRKRDRIFSATELSRLFADPDFGHIYEFLYLSIQRIDVVLQLHSSNVNLDRSIISFPRGKGGKLQDIPLTVQLRDWFERHGREGYLFCVDGYDATKYNSRRALASRIRIRLAKIIDVEGWEPARIHDFRATGASMLATMVPMPVLMQYGGWDTPSVCMRYYRTKPEDLQIPDLPMFRHSGHSMVTFRTHKRTKS